MSPPIRAVIIEDEPLARQVLRSMMAGLPWIVCTGEAADGRQATILLGREKPELIFLDVQLPGATGIEVLSAAECDAVVIFTTASDSHALAAYELGAIDYLRKPFSRERLLRAVERAIPLIDAMRARAGDTGGSGGAGDALARIASLRRRVAEASAPSGPLRTVHVRHRGVVLPIRLDDIQRFEADGDFVAVLTNGHRYLVYLNLGDLWARLDPAEYQRVHRSHIVRLSAIASVNALDANRVELVLRDGARVVASRAGTRALRARMRNM